MVKPTVKSNSESQDLLRVRIVSRPVFKTGLALMSISSICPAVSLQKLPQPNCDSAAPLSLLSKTSKILRWA